METERHTMKYSTKKGVDGLRDCLRIRNKKEKEIWRLEMRHTWNHGETDRKSESQTDRKTDIPWIWKEIDWSGGYLWKSLKWRKMITRLSGHIVVTWWPQTYTAEIENKPQIFFPQSVNKSDNGNNSKVRMTSCITFHKNQLKL